MLFIARIKKIALFVKFELVCKKKKVTCQKFGNFFSSWLSQSLEFKLITDYNFYFTIVYIPRQSTTKIKHFYSN